MVGEARKREATETPTHVPRTDAVDYVLCSESEC